MWYTTTREDQPVRPPGDVLAEPASDTPASDTVVTLVVAPGVVPAERMKAVAATTPGTEYWLP